MLPYDQKFQTIQRCDRKYDLNHLDAYSFQLKIFYFFIIRINFFTVI